MASARESSRVNAVVSPTSATSASVAIWGRSCSRRPLFAARAGRRAVLVGSTGRSRAMWPRAVRPGNRGPKEPMKLAFIIQRYGSEVLGVSEHLCRLLAERLASQHEVEVLTTCARD